MTIEATKSRKLVFLALAAALVWPPVYSIFVYPRIASADTTSEVSTAELQRFLGARKYTLKIPAEQDGWYLSLESVIDGVQSRSGGASVVGNTEVVLLVRQLPGTPKIEYCWYTSTSEVRGLIDDPLVEAGPTVDRAGGPVAPGDWLLRGDRKSIKSDGDADFEVRVQLRDPDHEEDA